MWTLEQLHVMTMQQSAAELSLRGFGNVRAEQMAKAAGLSVGSFYRRYGSKGGFAHLVRQWAESEVCRVARLGFEMELESPEGSFRQAFEGFWRELAWCATTKPEFFCFAFLHWHADFRQPQAPGREARALVREVLAYGEREGALAPGSVRVGEGLIWGALAELVRALAAGEEQLSQEDVNASGRALWKALAAAEDSGPRGAGTPSPGAETMEGTGPDGAGALQPDSTLTENMGPEGMGAPQVDATLTEDMDPEGAGAPPPGAAPAETRGPGGAGTPLSDAAPTEDSGARSRDRGAPAARALCPSEGTSRRRMCHASRRTVRSTCSGRRSGPTISGQRPAGKQGLLEERLRLLVAGLVRRRAQAVLHGHQSYGPGARVQLVPSSEVPHDEGGGRLRLAPLHRVREWQPARRRERRQVTQLPLHLQVRVPRKRGELPPGRGRDVDREGRSGIVVRSHRGWIVSNEGASLEVNESGQLAISRARFSVKTSGEWRGILKKLQVFSRWGRSFLESVSPRR
jgi:AcrR family transcriptional regulator